MRVIISNGVPHFKDFYFMNRKAANTASATMAKEKLPEGDRVDKITIMGIDNSGKVKTLKEIKPRINKSGEVNRPAKTKLFNGKRYDLTGDAPSKDLKSLKDWAKFQKDVNEHDVKIIPTKNGYEGYIGRERIHSNKTNNSKIKIINENPSPQTTRKIFIVDGPPEKVKTARLTASKRCKVKVVNQGKSLGAGVYRSGGRQHIGLY
jgi:hypothetical protein